MHIHEVTYSTNNNIYIIASYTKIVKKFNLKAFTSHFSLPWVCYTQIPTHQLNFLLLIKEFQSTCRYYEGVLVSP